ncbi:MAG: 30S ribosomal protein S16 [Nitrospinae bacterium]|nr:30S ribosomal protein S16 [Nitrospinota bacterium]
MAVVIRMSRGGKKKKPFYRIVAADKRFCRDGRYLEIVGTWDPKLEKATVKKEAAEKWIKNGAQVSETVKKLFIKNGVSLATVAPSAA